MLLSDCIFFFLKQTKKNTHTDVHHVIVCVCVCVILQVDITELRRGEVVRGGSFIFYIIRQLQDTQCE